MSKLSIYYASDIHGSGLLWRKFLNAGPFYNVDMLLMGGDVCGKAAVPIVDRGNDTWESTFMGRHLVLQTAEQVKALEDDITFNGMYPYRARPEEIAAIQGSGDQEAMFDQIIVRTFEHWLDIADEKLGRSALPCYVMPGNDDAWVIDGLFTPQRKVTNCDQRVIDLGQGYSLLSVGLANPTPWDTPRESSEEDLEAIIDKLATQVPDMRRAIFNLHVPPYDSTLDTAPLLDASLRPQLQGGNAVMVPVGSTAVRAVIERHQPLLALHGHIHESKGAKTIGSTLCINPGSVYNTGTLDGVLVHLDGDKVKRYQFVSG